MPVIYLLEAVQIQQDEAEGLVALDAPANSLFYATAICNARKFVP